MMRGTMGRRLAACAAALVVCAAVASTATAIPPAPGNCQAYQNTGLEIDHCLITYPGISVTVSPQIVRLGHVVTVTESNSFPACDPNVTVTPCTTGGAAFFGFRIKFVLGDQSPSQPLPNFTPLRSSGAQFRFRVTGQSNGHWLSAAAAPSGDFPLLTIVDPTHQRGFGATSSEGAFYVLPRCGTAAADVGAHMASGACCPTQPNITGTARAVRGGSEVIAKVKATGLRDGCGAARLSWSTSTAHGGFEKLHRSGNTITGTTRLSKREICTLRMTATVQESDAVGAAELPFSGDLPVLTGTAVRGPNGETTLILNADKMRSQADCGPPKVDALIGVAGATRLIHLGVAKIPGKPQAFVGRAVLPAHTCFTSADFIIRQRDIESSDAGVRVLGDVPTMCSLGP